VKRERGPYNNDMAQTLYLIVHSIGFFIFCG
jgi:hypothetical protein